MQPPKPVRAAKTAYTSPAARSNCARIAESMRSFFSLALAMAFTRAGCRRAILIAGTPSNCSLPV
jgi:hypothetical protein